MVAIESLGALGAANRIEQFTHALADRSWEVRVAAAEQLELELSKTGHAPVQLIRLLTDSSNLVRLQAAEALGEIGDKGALSKLRALLRDKDPSVRRYVAEAIGRLGGVRDRTLLIKALKDEQSKSARVGLYHGLYLLDWKQTLPDLISLLDSKECLVRSAAAAALRDVKRDPIAAKSTTPKLRAALKREATPAREQMELTLRHLASRRRHR